MSVAVQNKNCLIPRTLKVSENPLHNKASITARFRNVVFCVDQEHESNENKAFKKITGRLSNLGRLLYNTILYNNKGRAIALAVSCWLPTAAARVPSRA
jgi:hypothetical protein